MARATMRGAVSGYIAAFTFWACPGTGFSTAGRHCSSDSQMIDSRDIHIQINEDGAWVNAIYFCIVVCSSHLWSCGEYTTAMVFICAN